MEIGKPRNLYYFNPKVVDIGVMRKNAQDLSRGDSRNKPVQVTIHFHKLGEPCHPLDGNHEVYEPKEKENQE